MNDHLPAAFVAAMDQESAWLYEHLRDEHHVDLHDRETWRIVDELMGCLNNVLGMVVEEHADDPERLSDEMTTTAAFWVNVVCTVLENHEPKERT